MRAKTLNQIAQEAAAPSNNENNHGDCKRHNLGEKKWMNF